MRFFPDRGGHRMKTISPYSRRLAVAPAFGARPSSAALWVVARARAVLKHTHSKRWRDFGWPMPKQHRVPKRTRLFAPRTPVAKD
jgi:hypothetical protein